MLSQIGKDGTNRNITAHLISLSEKSLLGQIVRSAVTEVLPQTAREGHS